MAYKIDNTEVNAAGEWTHVVAPRGPSMREEHIFPGIAAVFSVVGPPLPPDLVITGFLDATDATLSLAQYALATLIHTETLRMADVALHSVEISGAVYPSCQLIEFKPSGPMQRALASGTTKVRAPVQYRWRQMLWSTPS